MLFVAVALGPSVGLRGQSPPPTPLRLLTPQGSRPLPSLVVNDNEFIALDELVLVFPIVVRDDQSTHSITVTWKGKTAMMNPDQSLASVSGRLISLPSTPIKIGGKWFVPIDFIGRVLVPIADGPLEFRKASRLVIAGAVRLPRVVVRHELPGPQAHVTLDISPATPHSIVQEATRLVVRFDADALDTSIGPAPAQSVVTGIHPTETGTGIALDLGPRFGSFRATDMPGDATTMHLVVDVFPTLESSAGPASPIAPPVQLPLPTPGTATHVIVIDPGHGGPDEGVRGAKGTLEKDVTLAVARRLKVAIESRIGARVLLTREDDRIVSPDDRAALANNNKGDVFVSLHVAGSPQTRLSGASVFSLTADSAAPPAAGSPAAETVSMPVFGGASREISLTPWERAQASHVNDSTDLAQRIEATLRSAVPMSPRPRQQAPLRVLVGANMPAVLVEIGYLTNPDQEAALAAGDFQSKVAQALADAVALFDNAQRSLANGAGAPR